MFFKKVVISLFCLVSFIAIARECYSKNVDELLSKSGFDAQDSKKINELYVNIKKLDVEEDKVLLIIENSIKGGVDSTQLLRILTLISKMAVEDIPPKALINKVLEGFAKGAPIEVIIKEAESKVLSLKNAKSILNYLILKGFEVKQPDLAVNIISIYLTKGWTPSSLKLEIESGGLNKQEFHELSLFLKSSDVKK